MQPRAPTEASPSKVTPVAASSAVRPSDVFRADPAAGWLFKANSEVRVRFREGVVQRIGADGWRRVPGGATATGPRIAFYGCSFTYGAGLGDEETFCAFLQRERPDVRVLNRGVSGHGTVQNLVQLRRDIAAGAVDAAAFAVIGDHRFRNVAHPQRMRAYLQPRWRPSRTEHVPIARLDANGRVRIRYLPLVQPLAADPRLEHFLPDEHALNRTTLAVLALAAETAAAAAIPLRLLLLDREDEAFSRIVLHRFDGMRDVSVPLDEAHTFKPADPHPNVRANELYAGGILPVLDALAREAREGHGP